MLKKLMVKCYEIGKYVKPKTFNFTRLNEEKNKVNHLGYVAQDFEKVVPREWEGIKKKTDDNGHKRLDSCKTAVITHRVVKHSETARKTNYLQVVFNAERRGKKSIIINTKSQMTSRQK